jgi:UDP-N-acetylglucosamine 1-carboxyvinyltransferase
MTMADLIVNGGKPLSGEITPSGYKNSIVALIPATLLTDEVVTLTNVPDITDVRKHLDFMKSIGSTYDWNKEECTLKIDNSKIDSNASLDEYPADLGSAPYFMPVLAHRMGKIQIQKRLKGCSLGIRELDPRIEAMKALGATVTYDEIIEINAENGFHSGEVWFDYQAVVSTGIYLLTAVLAKGTSSAINVASEPQIQDLANFLVKIGANIEGIGTNKLTVHGVDKLSGCEFRVVDDYYEVATFLAIGAMTGGEIRVNTQNQEHMGMILKMFERLGVSIEVGENYYKVSKSNLIIEQPMTRNMLPKIEAAPWPYFPVDLLPPFVALATKAHGEIMFWNKIYEGGLLWISELMKFGAHAHLSDPHRVIIFGDKPLRPAVVDAPYIIRVAVALFMLAASIEGESIIKNADTIKRAHPDFVLNLNELGADVEWRV